MLSHRIHDPHSTPHGPYHFILTESLSPRGPGKLGAGGKGKGETGRMGKVRGQGLGKRWDDKSDFNFGMVCNPNPEVVRLLMEERSKGISEPGFWGLGGSGPGGAQPPLPWEIN